MEWTQAASGTTSARRGDRLSQAWGTHFQTPSTARQLGIKLVIKWSLSASYFWSPNWHFSTVRLLSKWIPRCRQRRRLTAASVWNSLVLPLWLAPAFSFLFPKQTLALTQMTRWLGSIHVEALKIRESRNGHHFPLYFLLKKAFKL